MPPAAAPGHHPGASPATSILPGSAEPVARSGSTRIQQPSAIGQQAPVKRSSARLWVIAVVIGLMVGFGVLLLLRPPSELFGLGVGRNDVTTQAMLLVVAGKHRIPAIHGNRTYVRLRDGNER